MRRAGGWRAGLAIGLVLCLTAATGVAYPLWWQHRQAVVGGAAIARLERANRTVAARRAGRTTWACSGPTGPGPGVLRIARTHVVAPVAPGVSEATLAVSVGHVSGGPWPGQLGIAVLEAHDVGYFARNDTVRPGDLLRYSYGCRTDTFRVVSSRVERPGQAIAPVPGGRGLALISCWPSNALWWTPDRLVVRAQLVSAGVPPAGVGTGARPPDVALWSQLPAVATLPPGVPTLPGSVFNDHLAGTLTILGAPSPQFTSSPLPLRWESVALQALAAYRRGVQVGASWLATLAGSARPAGWMQLPASAIDVTLVVAGSQVTMIDLSGATARVPVTFPEIVRAGHLYVR